MKTFNRLLCTAIIIIALMFAGANLALSCFRKSEYSGRPYKVEVERLCNIIEAEGIESINIKDCDFVTAVVPYSDDNFYRPESDYIVREINSVLYRFDYKTDTQQTNSHRLILNISLGAISVAVLSILLYIRQKIIKPFDHLKEVPYELSKGNLTPAVKESKNRFFGRFLWGVDMLRENMEQQKERELNLQRDKKMLLLSLSHDIKTPISAIKLYSKALSKELYPDKEKQKEIAESINLKADEIEGYVSQIITASREDFLTFDINNSEFYLSELISDIKDYYTEKLSLVKTQFIVEDYSDMLLFGDKDRSIEVIQNLIENAIKYGDGRSISISFATEDDCLLISVSNGGCTLTQDDLIHIFDSFWRGENSTNARGSGLGLYICKQLMLRMNGDIFADIKDDTITVSTVFQKA